MDKNKLNKIDASLKQGQLFTGKWSLFFYLLISFCALVPSGSILYLLLVFFKVEVFDSETIIVLTCSSTICLLIILGTSYVLHRNYKLKKKILLWLEDAIELTAQTTTLDRFRTLGHLVAETKLQVEFYYDGIKKMQSSYDDTKKDYWFKRNGYFKVLSKYADKSINILYSPKYEQVLILKL